MEAKTTLKRIASSFAKKWRQAYARKYIYVKSRIVISFVRATHQCIRGSRVPAHRISAQRLQWEEGSGLNLFM